MKYFKRLALSATLLLSGFGIADVCTWDGTTFPNSNNCTNQDCDGPGPGTHYWACKTSDGGTSCCICDWYVYPCNAGGNGVSATRIYGGGQCPGGTHNHCEQPY